MIYTLTSAWADPKQIVQWYDIVYDQDYLNYKNLYHDRNHGTESEVDTPYQFFIKHIGSNFGIDSSDNDLLLIDLEYLYDPKSNTSLLDEIEKNINKLSDSVFKKVIVLSKDFYPVEPFSSDKVEILSPNHYTDYSNYIEKKFNYYLINASFNKIHNTSFELFDNFKYISKNKKSTLLMGSFKPHRTILYNLLKKENMLDDMYFSYMSYNIDNLNELSYQSHFLDNNNFDKDKVLKLISQEEYRDLKKQLPICLDGNFNEENFNLLAPLPYLTNSYVHIVECNKEGDNILYTDEKVFRPFLTFSIPLFLGQKGLHQLLKNYGFDVFDDFFDIGRDSDGDDIERMKSSFENIRKIHEMSYGDLQFFYIQNHQRLLHNYNRLRELGKIQVQEFINILNDYK